MPKNRDKFKGLATAGGLAFLAGTAGLVLSGQSQAQDKAQATTTTRQSYTHMTYVAPTKTADTTQTQPTVYETRTVTKADGSKAVVRTPVAGPAAIDAARFAKPSAAVTSSSAAAQPSTATSSTVKPTTTTAIKPVSPVLLRKPLAPAKVQWSAAIAQSNRMRTVRPSNTFVARLPKAAIDRTRLPVILPRAGGTVDTAQAKMVSFGDAYALNLPQPKGLQITMYGNRSFVPTDKGAISARPVQKLAGVAEDIRISQMEDGWTATFTRYGVVYSLDVSCDDINNADCKTDAFIRKAIAQFDDVTVGADAQAEADGKISADGKRIQAGPFDGLINTFNKMNKGG